MYSSIRLATLLRYCQQDLLACHGSIYSPFLRRRYCISPQYMTPFYKRSITSTSIQQETADPVIAHDQHKETSVDQSAAYDELEQTAVAADTNPENATTSAADPEGKILIEKVDEWDKRTNELKQLMRLVPHSVAIVTAADGKSTQSEYDFSGSYGVVISSFSTVTLGPPAMISFNLKRPSRTLDAIEKNKLFRVTFLRSFRDSVTITKALLDQQHQEAFESMKRMGRLNVSNLGTLAYSDANDEASLKENYRKFRLPKIVGPTVAFSINCEIMPEKCIEVGDHNIVVAKVIWTDHSKGKLEGAFTSLLYFQGGFGAAKPFEDLTPTKQSNVLETSTKSKEGVSSSQDMAVGVSSSQDMAIGVSSSQDMAVARGSRLLFKRPFQVGPTTARHLKLGQESSSSDENRPSVDGAKRKEASINRQSHERQSFDSGISATITKPSEAEFPTFYLEDRVDDKQS